MTTEAALVAAIRATPTDDQARLVLADFLDEFRADSDQCRARSEWIRLVCWTPATRKCKRTGKRHRVPGERAWLRDNAHRLWPHLHRTRCVGRVVHATLLTCNVVLSIPLSVGFDRPARRGGTLTAHTVDFTNVSIFCDRGVTSEVYVTFLRAERVAVAAALDEPFADLKFSTLPDWCFSDPHDGDLVVYRKPFVSRGLLGVWDALDGEPGREFPGGKAYKAYKACRSEIAVNEALTAWARREAANPQRVPEPEGVTT